MALRLSSEISVWAAQFVSVSCSQRKSYVDKMVIICARWGIRGFVANSEVMLVLSK